MLVRRMTEQLARDRADNVGARDAESEKNLILYKDNKSCREEGRRKANTGHLSDPFQQHSCHTLFLPLPTPLRELRRSLQY